MNEINIERYSGDTYPVTVDIKLDDSRIDLAGWELYMYINERQADNTVKNLRISGVTPLLKRGEVSFYPRAMKTNDITDSNAITRTDALVSVGEHSYAITREKDVYNADDYEGTLVTMDFGKTYIPYDVNNTDHLSKQRFSSFREIMTHQSGVITIVAKL